ncbi:MAG: hypothetical protein C0478_09210 [Planctomyces sp.]|nr:hypothetical protein [Planctomyces sp.]
MEALDILSRWTHIGTAVVIVGGSVFLRFVVLPVASKLPEDQHLALRSAIISRWKMFIHVGILLFLVSGFYNYFQAMPKHKGQPIYHALIGTKILLALVVFALSSILVGRSGLAEKLRTRSAFWLTVVIVIATVIIGISGYVKVAVPVKTPVVVVPAAAVPAVATPAVTVEIAP